MRKSSRMRFFWMVVGVLVLGAGCTGAQLRFVPVVTRDQDPSGWQAACLEALFQNMTTGDTHICTVGIGLPMHTAAKGFIAAWWAEDLTAACINEAAKNVVQPAPPTVPTALACADFRTELTRLLRLKLEGARVKSTCDDNVPRTQVGFTP